MGVINSPLLLSLRKTRGHSYLSGRRVAPLSPGCGEEVELELPIWSK